MEVILLEPSLRIYVTIDPVRTTVPHKLCSEA